MMSSHCSQGSFLVGFIVIKSLNFRFDPYFAMRKVDAINEFENISKYNLPKMFDCLVYSDICYMRTKHMFMVPHQY